MKYYMRHDERGLVSIVVVMILMIVITLITLNFAQVIRREQRQGLDRQLQTQAFYAAESGINDARTFLGGLPSTSLSTLLPKTTCGTQPGYTGLDGRVDPANNVTYSCLLIDPNPPSLEFRLDPGASSKVFPLNTATPLSQITLGWSGAAASTAGCPAATDAVFTPNADWNCNYAALRLDLVPIGAIFTRDTLAKANFSAVIVPTTGGGGSVVYAVGNNKYGGKAQQGLRAAATCTTVSGRCSLTITGLTAAGPTTKWYARLSSIYKPATVTLTGASGPSAVSFIGTQVLVDSTGKAQDVLHRMQVRLPISTSSLPYPDFAIQTQDSLCKDFSASAEQLSNAGSCPAD